MRITGEGGNNKGKAPWRVLAMIKEQEGVGVTEGQ